MDIREFEQALNEGESSTVEFKRCGGNPSRDTYETVCSFANHAGGSIYLGVEDAGTARSVPTDAALSIERNATNTTGAPQMFSPTLLVETDRFEYEGKTIIRIWVPMNSSVFRFKGQVYDRAADADKRIDGEMQITQMYIHKQNIFTERRVYPGVPLTIESAVRKLISDKGYATASETAKLAHAAPRTVSRYFTEQTRAGTLVAQGNTRSRKYLAGPQWASKPPM